jgi:hypothetical protein
MLVPYPFTVRDSTVSSGDNRKAGLTLTIAQCSTLGATPTPITGAARPTIVPIGLGQYIALYDPEANGEAMLQVDAGSTLSNPSDRYIDIPLTRDSSRIQSGINASGQVALGMSSSPAQGLAVTGTTASVVIVSGLPSGRNYALQSLYHQASGEFRQIASQTPTGANYTFTLGTGADESGPFSVAPLAGDALIPVA